MRARIQGTETRPRFSVFRSNQHVWTALINDGAGHTLIAANDTEIQKKKNERLLMVHVGEKVGELLAQKAVVKKITEAIFDRGGYKYHGIVKAVAEGARKGGLKL